MKATAKETPAETSRRDDAVGALEESTLRHMHHEEKLSQREMARRLGVTREAVMAAMRRLSIEVRPAAWAVPAVDRFWSAVSKGDGDTCWLWTASRTPEGYGQFGAEKRRILAHRFSYELSVGPIPEGLELDHLCRNRGCVRPDHLQPVTRQENARRSPLAARNIFRKREADDLEALFSWCHEKMVEAQHGRTLEHAVRAQAFAQVQVEIRAMQRARR